LIGIIKEVCLAVFVLDRRLFLQLSNLSAILAYIKDLALISSPRKIVEEFPGNKGLATSW
jgi:hypothetical protein